MKSLWQFIISPSNSRTLGLLALLVLTAAIPLTVYVAQQQQQLKQAAQEAPSLRVFATSQQYNGNLGGTAGADASCQQVADNTPALSGSVWKAWISSSTENAKDRIADGKYVRLDGQVIANNKQDLIDGNIQKNINKNELNQTFLGRVWTGTSQVGSVLGTQTTPTPTPPECGVQTGKPNGCECSKDNQCTSNKCSKPSGVDDYKICLGGSNQTATPTQSPTNTPTPTPTSVPTPTPTTAAPPNTPTPTSGSNNYQNCNSWTSSDSSVKGVFGSTKETNGRWTDDSRNSCNNTHSLYCFEQTSQTPSPTPTPASPPSETPTPTLPPGVTPTPTPVSPPLSEIPVFVTSSTYNGNLGGLSGADVRCQTLANSAGLNGAWIAWVSVNSQNAKDRIPDAKYVRMDGQTIANNKADLTNGNIQRDINRDEGNRLAASGTGRVWTGTKKDGMRHTDTCSNWTSQSSSIRGRRGNLDSNGSSWTDSASNDCDGQYRLYCFKTAGGPPEPPLTNTPTPTPTLPPGVTPTPTPTPTAGATPTPTPPITGARLSFDLALEGVSSNPEAGNVNPRDPERELEVRIFTPGGNQIQEYEGTVIFQRDTGRFTGTVATPNLPGGTYDIRVKTNGYLTRLFANQPVAQDTETVLRSLTLIAGDVNDDNGVDISDYTLIANTCFGTKALFSPNCQRADLDDDGDVDIFDANFVIRSMAKRVGE